jgi:hypothetical protein
LLSPFVEVGLICGFGWVCVGACATACVAAHALVDFGFV